MKTRNFIYVALAFMALSCAKEIAPETSAPEQEYNIIEKSFTAGIDATKTTMADGFKIQWKANDGVTIIDNVAKTAVKYLAAETGAVSALNPATAGTGVAEGATEIYAAYPWRDGNNALVLENGDELNNCYLTPDQRPSRNGYYATVHYAMAKADATDNLHFKNVNGFIKFNIAAELDNLVKAVYIFSNNDEEICGAFKMKWNNGDPKFVYKDNSANRPYVRAYNSNGTALRAGDYFLGILPVTFEKGFTVVLQMMDGTQLYKRTEKTLTVREGEILPMKPLAKADYDTDDVNYLVLYNEGFTDKMKISGISFDRFKNAKGERTFVLVTKPRNETINGNATLYFVTPSADNAIISGYNKTDYAVIGMNKNRRSTVELKSDMTLANNEDRESIFMFANLNVNVTADKSLVRGFPQNFGNIVINNSAFKGLRRHLLDLHNGTTWGDKVSDQAVLYRTIIEDSEFSFENCANDHAIFMRGNKLMWSNTLKFVNNIVTSTVTNGKTFRILTGQGTGKFMEMVDGVEKEVPYSGVGLTVDDLTISNNTLHNTYTKAIVSLIGVQDVYMCENNVFDITMTANVEVFAIYKRYDVPADQDTRVNPASGHCRNNYYYNYDSKDANGNPFKWTTPSKYTANLGTKEQPIALSKSPLSSIWKPAEGKFGAYSFTLAGEGDAPAYNEAGAQRADMIPETADLDSPAANYVSLDLGSY